MKRMDFISTVLTIWHFNRKKGVQENTSGEFPMKLASHPLTGPTVKVRRHYGSLRQKALIVERAVSTGKDLKFWLIPLFA